MRVLLLLIFLASGMPAFLSAVDPGPVSSVFQLKQQGWKLEEKENYIETRPGKKPYQMLKRDVQIVLYQLHRGSEELFCRVEYDSQQDTIRELCSASEDELKKMQTD